VHVSPPVFLFLRPVIKCVPAAGLAIKTICICTTPSIPDNKANIWCSETKVCSDWLQILAIISFVQCINYGREPNHPQRMRELLPFLACKPIQRLDRKAKTFSHSMQREISGMKKKRLGVIIGVKTHIRRIIARN
jgi:hypothetical protein